MKRSDARPIREILNQLFKEQHLELKLNETRLMHAWKEVVGNGAASYTTHLSVTRGVLYVNLSSAVLRNELLMCRSSLLEKLNERVGAKVIHDIVFR